MQSWNVNSGSLALGPTFLMTHPPGLRRGSEEEPPIMGYCPVERGLFRGAEAFEQGTKQASPPTAKPWPCATPAPAFSVPATT